MKAARLGAWPLVVIGWLGCGHRSSGPADAIAAFGSAVERKDHAAAYGMMSDEYRKRVPLAEFRAQLEAGGAETVAAGRKLAENAPRTPLRIEVEVDLGEKLPLVLQAGRWRIDGQPFDYYSQKTPRAALRSFVRALERRRYDVALRLVPARYRPTVTGDKLKEYWEGGERKVENQKLLQLLRAHINAPIIEVGDEAHMPYGERSEVRFVREGGVWKVEDPD
jgi:hypothetical protein